MDECQSRDEYTPHTDGDSSPAATAATRRRLHLSALILPLGYLMPHV